MMDVLDIVAMHRVQPQIPSDEAVTILRKGQTN